MELFGEGNNFEEVFNFQPEDVPKQVNKEKKNAKKKNKVDYVKTMQAALATPFICKNHEGVYMKIRQSTKNPPLCGSCGFKCEGKSGFISCPKTNVCFSLCTSCRICPKNHVLRNCASLTNFSDKNSSFGNDLYTCSGCSIQKKVGPEGVFHCPFCSWSVCTSCIDNLNEFWRNKNENVEENSIDG